MTDGPPLFAQQNPDSNTLAEILRQAELHLQAQLSAAVAADQRAYTFAGLSTASSVLLVGASFSLLTSSDPNSFMACIAFLTAVGLFVGAWIAVVSARSVDFEFAGSQPLFWVEDVAQKKPLEQSLAEQCKHYDEAIAANRKTMTKNSSLFNTAVNISLASVGLGAVAYLYWAQRLLTNV